MKITQLKLLYLVKYFFLGLFDFIECRHVLDHVVDPTSVLSKMAGILKPNGGISLSINGGCVLFIIKKY